MLIYNIVCIQNGLRLLKKPIEINWYFNQAFARRRRPCRPGFSNFLFPSARVLLMLELCSPTTKAMVHSLWMKTRTSATTLSLKVKGRKRGLRRLGITRTSTRRGALISMKWLCSAVLIHQRIISARSILNAYNLVKIEDKTVLIQKNWTVLYCFKK